MAEECKYTTTSKFLRTQPNIERIRSVFAENISLKGEVIIGAYDFCIVFIGVTNDDDCKNVWCKRSIKIDRIDMWLKKESPDFSWGRITQNYQYGYYCQADSEPINPYELLT